MSNWKITCLVFLDIKRAVSTCLVVISMCAKHRPPFLWLLSVMEGNYALLVFVLQWTIYSRVFAAGEDSASRSGYFITRENKRLAGNVVKWFESPSFMSCSQSCLRNAWCSSTNFKVSSQEDGRGTCELNKHDSSLINENTKLNEQQGFIFSMFLKARYVIFEKSSVLQKVLVNQFYLKILQQQWQQKTFICTAV